MKLVFISDTHRWHRSLDMPEGDILFHTGDFTDWGSFTDIRDFGDWLRGLPYKHKVVIAGNHDVKFETVPEMCKSCLLQKKNIHYLENQTIELEGLKIFGSPYTPKFGGAFQLGYLSGEFADYKFWKSQIPDKVDILLTHGPPFGILDEINRTVYHDYTEKENCGSQGLLKRVLEVKPKIHAFGHIHESYGMIKQRYGITFINAAMLNWRTNNLNKPVVIEWK